MHIITGESKIIDLSKQNELFYRNTKANGTGRHILHTEYTSLSDTKGHARILEIETERIQNFVIFSRLHNEVGLVFLFSLLVSFQTTSFHHKKRFLLAFYSLTLYLGKTKKECCN